MSNYKSMNQFNKRLLESQNIKNKYPDRIPIICEKSFMSRDAPKIDKNKYLVPNDLTIGQFVYVIRKRIKLLPYQALYLFINNFIPPTSEIIGNLYNNYQDLDGFLYITYSTENTFG
jgi:GABA(A) receptor-associated protein